MRPARALAALTFVAAAVGAVAHARFRREMAALNARLDAGGRLVDTAAGPLEIGVEGHGAPVLMIHGAGGGYDQGLFVGRETFGPEHRIIAPSRFGYLRTPLPRDASPAAQADAHAALLDHLKIDRCIVAGVSAGGPSAIEMALRHPDRVSALVLLVPRTWEPAMVMGVEGSAPSQVVLRVIEGAADFLFWLGIRLARPALVRFVGVPPELDAAAPRVERDRVTAVLRSILPLSRRAAGVRADSRTVIAEWPLQRIAVPTLIVTARDDLFQTLPGARYTAEHIHGAKLKVLESGGHLMVGRGEEVRATVAAFLARHGP